MRLKLSKEELKSLASITSLVVEEKERQLGRKLTDEEMQKVAGAGLFLFAGVAYGWLSPWEAQK